MATITSKDGTTIAYETTGSGPAVILVDAASGFREFGPMRSLAAALSPHFTVFVYDRRGRGESTDTLPYAVEREVEDLQALIDAAGGSAFVHGFSSGGVLALQAAAHGRAVKKLTMLEPPLLIDPPDPDEPDLAAELSALLAENRRGDAMEHFHTSIGVPAEMTAGMREAPFWPLLESIAHTLVYDTKITRSLTAERLTTITTPTLILYSEATDERLKSWAQRGAAALPNGTSRSLPGEWHGVANEVLAPALVAFFAG